MARERIIEGRWNCASCGAKGVLGRHKTCPGCGNPREQGSETSFDFGGTTGSGGSTAETVTDAELVQLAQAGEDWHCGYCESANKGDAAVCRNCGAERGEAQPRTPPRPIPQALVSPAAAPAKPRRWPYALVVAMLSCCGFCMWGIREHETTGRVASRSWTRHVERQTFTRVEKQGWKDELRAQAAVMPVAGAGEVAGVQDVSDCRRKQRGTRQVADGTERVCTDRTRRVACGSEEKCSVVDDGNGFGREVCHDVTKYCSESYEDCRNQTRYRTEPVYGDECRYRTWEWQRAEEGQTAGGDDPPRWPELVTGQRDRLVKTEKYRVEVAWGDGKAHVVEPPNESDFARWKPGATVKLTVTNLGTVTAAVPEER